MDTLNEEESYAKTKYYSNNLIDLKAWNYFTQTLSISRIKYIYRRNVHGKIDNKINKNIKSNDYPRCSESRS